MGENAVGTRAQRGRTEGATGVDSERERSACTECGGRLVRDARHGETVCSDCGLVVAKGEIDRGLEWRGFDHGERGRKSRVGAPITDRLHDKGLSTAIDWQDKDAYGNRLSARKRQRMSRLRTWNKRFRTHDAGQRNLR